MAYKILLLFCFLCLLMWGVLARDIKILVISEQKQDENYCWEADNRYSCDVYVLKFSLSPEKEINAVSSKLIIGKHNKLNLFRLYNSKLCALGFAKNDDANNQAISELLILDSNGEIISNFYGDEKNGFNWDAINITDENNVLAINSIKCMDFDKREYILSSYNPTTKNMNPYPVENWLDKSDRYNCKIRKDGKIEVISFGLSGNFLKFVLSSEFVQKNNLASGFWFSILNNQAYQIFQYNDEKSHFDVEKKIFVYDKETQIGNIAVYPSTYKISGFSGKCIIFNWLSDSTEYSNGNILIYNYVDNNFLSMRLPMGGKLLGIDNDLYFVSHSNAISVLKKTKNTFKRIYDTDFPNAARIIEGVILTPSDEDK